MMNPLPPLRVLGLCAGLLMALLPRTDAASSQERMHLPMPNTQPPTLITYEIGRAHV